MSEITRVTIGFLFFVLTCPRAGLAADEPSYRLARFSADVTIPLGHRCMGVLPTKSKRIVDRLYAHGLVLLGPDEPIVLCAVDWCEIRNGAYDQWREALAKAAGTRRERVLVSSVHQHDAPVVDRGAARLLSQVGLPGELYDEGFHDRVVSRVAQSLRVGLKATQPITHLGLGKAKVDRIASSRRVRGANGRVTYGRGSRSGSDAFHRQAAEGQIDPFLRTVSLWNKDRPLLALHAYATHPMSYYGRGEVSSDFVGLARERRQRDDLSVRQIYVSGCSGDVTAGKYNDGSNANRAILTDRLYRGMVDAWKATRRKPIQKIQFRTAAVNLPYSAHANLSEAKLLAKLRDKDARVEDRIWAAMGLSSRDRVASRQSIDLPCIDLGSAQIVLFPGEVFVGYQLMAQKMRPDSFVVSIGYGECWPGYVPTRAAEADKFHDKWLWVDRGCEQRLQAGLSKVLARSK